MGAPAPAMAQEDAPATSGLTPAQEQAVRVYMLNTLACMLECSADDMDKGDPQGVEAFVDAFEASHKAVAAIPTDGLPEEFQAYIRESDAISEAFVEESRLILAEEGMDPEDASREVQAALFEAHSRFEELEEKYPVAASWIGREALKDFSDVIMRELALKEKAMDWMQAHEEGLDSGEIPPGDVLRYLASEVRKAAQSH